MPQISLTWSNGSRHSTQRYCALQAVEPNSETSSVAGDPHWGQRTWRAVGISDSGIGPLLDGAGPGGEMPAAARAARPAGVIQSVVQAGWRLTRTSTRVEAGGGELAHQVVAHRGHRRAAGVGRGDVDDDVGVADDVHVAQHPEVGQRQHRQLGVGDPLRDGPSPSRPATR